MTIYYDFGGDCPYEYEPEPNNLKKAIIDILCSEVKITNGKLYEESGAYQMAMYVVHELDIIDKLGESVEDKLYDYFYDEAVQQSKEREENAREEDDWYGTMDDVRGL